ncbi:MAG: hypothetical protein A2138_17750 [Deltaproteobacteria bacterium RBG_16_71_12]|nr:MAG: hypothetical protein A2138_17750 [Deltaproteobacteria bacterium RBG_16_71_12]
MFTVAALPGAGCFEATNPCDPAADPDVQAQGTRITGIVQDQHGAALAGVPVTISGRSDTQVSALDGTFAFENLPPAADYELVALPSAPAVGGRAHTGALQCLSAVNDVDVLVVVPPESPELELVRATGERRLFVAFGAIGEREPGDITTFYEGGEVPRDAFSVNEECAQLADQAPLRYRVQVRSPFAEWQDARLSAFPWIDPMQVVTGVAAGERSAGDYSLPGVDDRCAAALCARFSYLEESLSDERARCVEVIGVVTGQDEAGKDVIEPLTPYGSYQVRVRTELRTTDEQRAAFTVPERILAAASTLPSQMSLLPGALLPVVDAAGNPRAVGDLRAIQPTAGGRFALVDGDWIAIIGDGADVLDDAAEDAVADSGAGQGALGSDDTCEQAMASDLTGDMAPTATIEPIAVLPSGSWVRVIRRGDDGGPLPVTSIKKVYVGSSAQTARDGPSSEAEAANAVEPTVSIDTTAEQAGSALRAFSYLSTPAASLVDVGVNPPDAYVLLYRSAFVMIEQGRIDELALRYFATDATVDPDTNDVGAGWAADIDNLSSVGAFGGACNDLRAAGDPNEVTDVGVLDRRRVSVCYDVAAALAEPVDLRDLDVFADGPTPRHVIADAQNDRLLVATDEALTCAGCTAGAVVPLAAQMTSVTVGREPVALFRTHTVDCRPDPVPLERILVANHGSGDLSVVAEDAGEVREVAVIPLPASPVSFLEDPAGPTCDDPFIWVIADDGQVIPVDMRGEPSVPLCGEVACALGTRGRGAVGGVQRRLPGSLAPGRALIGGAGLLGEVGFFTPSALKGAAYADQTDLQGEAAPPTP